MPAGSYTLSQPDPDDKVLLIEDASGSHSVFVEYEVTSSGTPHAQTDVSFNKYGEADFLSLIWIQGKNSGMQILPLKAERNAAKLNAADWRMCYASVAYFRRSSSAFGVRSRAGHYCFRLCRQLGAFVWILRRAVCSTGHDPHRRVWNPIIAGRRQE